MPYARPAGYGATLPNKMTAMGDVLDRLKHFAVGS